MTDDTCDDAPEIAEGAPNTAGPGPCAVPPSQGLLTPDNPDTTDPVTAVNLGSGMILLSDGTVLPITNYIDADGDDCAKEAAIVCVAGNDEHGWYALNLAGFSYRPMN